LADLRLVPHDVSTLTAIASRERGAWRRCFLETADSRLRGFIQGLLVGSVALDDFCSVSSDIDFVAVSEQRADPAQPSALAAVHSALGARRRRSVRPTATWR
jgi:hypothetical protein